MSWTLFASGMTSQLLAHPATGGTTERFDPVSCLDERVRRGATAERPVAPGRYIEVQGPDQAVVVPLGSDVTHIGRGLGADLRLDDASVSRRHAMIVNRPAAARLLDDRSANGTFMNGRRVMETELSDGDVLVLGRVVLRYLQV